jgi:PKD repeat protein
MKKIFTLFFFLLFTSFISNLFANTVLVSGYVKYANGLAVANRAVTISNDSLSPNNTCGVIIRVKYTNANGFYSDTVTCSGNITALKVSTPDCNGTLIINSVSYLPTTPNAVSNFTLSCNATSVGTCVANFTTSTANNVVTFTNSSVTSSTLAATIWSFGDGTTSTLASPVHTYAFAGTYMACLRILSSTGCSDSLCKAVAITVSNTPACNAEFLATKDSLNFKLYKFFAGVNTTYPNNDPVVERKWKWGDGDSLLGNVQNPTHLYATAGTYNVCLRVKTQSGCVSDLCKTITITNPASALCYATFSYVPQSSLVTFNSSNSTAATGDNIVYRKWVWGDSTAALIGNTISPQHQYAQPGFYTVCLTIKTASGCERTYCQYVTATNINSNCVPQFMYQRITAKKVAFNSTMSWAPLNDSIIERKWKFGDNTYITTGNIANPIHEYAALGVYTVCLKMKTALGCENEVCKQIFIQDSINISPTSEPIRIVNLYPNPVTTQMTTLVFSAFNNVAAELAIYDIYGVKKWSTNKTLMQGNNVTVIPTFMLPTGPYIFKVNTTYGIKSKHFFKL